MDAIVSAAKEEERRLLAQLANHPAFVRLQAVRNLINAYSGPATMAERIEAIQNDNIRAVGATQAQAMISRNVAAQVRNWVLPYLRSRGERVQSNVLLELAQKEGIAVGGKSPVATMSSYLSGMPELDNVRGQGYGLKEWSERDDSLRANGLAELAGISSDPQESAVDRPYADAQVPATRVRHRPNQFTGTTELEHYSGQGDTEEAEKGSGQEPSASSAEGDDYQW